MTSNRIFFFFCLFTKASFIFYAGGNIVFFTLRLCLLCTVCSRRFSFTGQNETFPGRQSAGRVPACLFSAKTKAARTWRHQSKLYEDGRRPAGRDADVFVLSATQGRQSEHYILVYRICQLPFTTFGCFINTILVKPAAQSSNQQKSMEQSRLVPFGIRVLHHTVAYL